MIDNRKIVKEIDEHNAKIRQSLRRQFHNTIQAGTKEYFKQLVGIKNFGYSKKYAENYDKIKWR